MSATWTKRFEACFYSLSTSIAAQTQFNSTDPFSPYLVKQIDEIHHSEANSYPDSNRLMCSLNYSVIFLIDKLIIHTCFFATEIDCFQASASQPKKKPRSPSDNQSFLKHPPAGEYSTHSTYNYSSNLNQHCLNQSSKGVVEVWCGRYAVVSRLRSHPTYP